MQYLPQDRSSNAEKKELEVSYPTFQSWSTPSEVEWVNRSEPNLQKAGLMAVGFGNGFVVTVPIESNVQLGDKVWVKQVIFRPPGNPNGYMVSIIIPAK